jgi:hypothetical protein
MAPKLVELERSIQFTKKKSPMPMISVHIAVNDALWMRGTHAQSKYPIVPDRFLSMYFGLRRSHGRNDSDSMGE